MKFQANLISMKINICGLVDNLYDDIKLLRKEFKKSESGQIWSNITISINNMKFRAEYSYEDLINSIFNSYEKHVIWRYNYLGIGPEQVSKKDKEILYRYFNGAKTLDQKEKEEYTTNAYIEQDIKNIIEYNTVEDKFENDGYIKEDEFVDIERKYNQIKSKKIENKWYSKAKKKKDTMWSHSNTSMEQYIIKSSKNVRKSSNNKSTKEELNQMPKEALNKPRRNQILFSEDETDGE